MADSGAYSSRVLLPLLLPPPPPQRTRHIHSTWRVLPGRRLGLAWGSPLARRPQKLVLPLPAGPRERQAAPTLCLRAGLLPPKNN